MRELLADWIGLGAKGFAFLLIPVALIVGAFSPAFGWLVFLGALAFFFGGRWLAESSYAKARARGSRSMDRIDKHAARQERMRNRFRGH